MADETTAIYVVGNNHNFGKAAVNAVELRALIFGEPVKAPAVTDQSLSGTKVCGKLIRFALVSE